MNRAHLLARVVFAVAGVVGFGVAAQRAPLYTDVTAEKLRQLPPEAREVVDAAVERGPVVIEAFVSDRVPSELEPARTRLLSLLGELGRMAQASDGRLAVRVRSPEPFTEDADDAAQNYGVAPAPMLLDDGARADVFLGFNVRSGSREQVVAQVPPGANVAYELTRAIDAVTQTDKVTVGIVATPVKIMGDFDLQSRRRIPPWAWTEALRKQYDIRIADLARPDALEGDRAPQVLIVPQLAALDQPSLDALKGWVDQGKPALITWDPLTAFAAGQSASEAPPPQMGGGKPPPPKGDSKAFLAHVGVVADDTKVLYDTFNPHPGLGLGDVPQVLFMSDRPDGTKAIGDDPVVAGLFEVAAMFAGEIGPADGVGSDQFVPLLSTGTTAGTSNYADHVQRSFLGVQGPIPSAKRNPVDGVQHVVAARVKTVAEGGTARNLIVFADLDMFANQFFALEARGAEELRFDNTVLAMNAIDDLTGKSDLLAVRARRPMLRPLSKVDELTEEARHRREAQIEIANDNADDGIKDAQKALDEAVAKVRERTDLDDNAREVLIQSAEVQQNRKLNQKMRAIERDKARELQRISAEHDREVDQVRSSIRALTVVLPPIPALLLGGLVLFRRRQQERDTIPQSRRASGSANAKESKDAKGGAS